MNKIYAIVLSVFVAVGLSSCAAGGGTQARVEPKEDAEIAQAEQNSLIPTVSKKAQGYEGELDTTDMLVCDKALYQRNYDAKLGSTQEAKFAGFGQVTGYPWDPSRTEIAESAWYRELSRQALAGDDRARYAVVGNLLNLLYVYFPDRLGFERKINMTNNQAVIYLIGEGSSESLTWKEVLEKLKLSQTQPFTELVSLVTENTPTVQVEYTENSAQGICRAYLDFAKDSLILSNRPVDTKRIYFDVFKQKILVSGELMNLGGLLEPDVTVPGHPEMNLAHTTEELITQRYAEFIDYVPDTEQY